MRNFGSLALKQVRSRRARSLLTAAGIVLGVGMILGVLLLSATINRTFTDLYDSVYGKADLIVSGGGQEESLPKRAFAEVEERAGRRRGRRPDPERLHARRRRRRGAARRLEAAERRRPGPRGGERHRLGDRRRARPRARPRDLDPGLAGRTRTTSRSTTASRSRRRTASGRFEVVGLFHFQSGFEFGGEGFAVMPLDAARKVMDKKRSFDEIDVIAEGGAETIASLERRIDRRFGKGVDVETPQTKSEDVESQLQAFNAILYFFAAMALFVGGFLIFNAFNMTVLQRTREIGMLRTLGTPAPASITGSVLREAALLGVLGAVLGLGLGFALA